MGLQTTLALDLVVLLYKNILNGVISTKNGVWELSDLSLSYIHALVYIVHSLYLHSVEILILVILYLYRSPIE